MADVSIIILSHNKPRFVEEAIRSVLQQTHPNWEALLVDSGVLYAQGFFDKFKDPRLKITASGETPELARTKNMASWCFNRWLNSGQINGELVMYLCDDDLIYPEAFATFWKFHLDHGREPQAMYSSQHIGLVAPDGTTQVIGERIADRPGGRFCKGRRLDCRVDYLQFCHTAKILEKFRERYQTTEYHLEDRRYARHADGIFMEKIGALTTIHPVPAILSMNRRTTESVNLSYSSSAAGRLYITLKEKVRGAWERMFDRPY